MPVTMSAPLLSQRTLNRTTLHRQLLLERSPMDPTDAVRHLVGLQAQIPLNPYTALWSRLDHFDPHAVGRLLIDRQLVRIVVMRGTIHLVTAGDALTLRALAQPVLDTEMVRHRDFGTPLSGVDLEPMLAFARELFAAEPRSGSELRAEMAARFPGHDPGALAFACRNRLGLVQVTPRGVWGHAAQTRSTTVEAWLGRSLDSSPSLDDVVLRYLAAFGPASVADVAAWSRLTGLREVLERLRPQLRTFRDPTGRELFDMVEAPIIDDDHPAPPRILPEYDNALLSHADRSRLYLDPSHRQAPYAGNGIVKGAFLSDGFVAGTWRIDRDRASGSATMVLQPVRTIGRSAQRAVAAEAERYLAFAENSAAATGVAFSAQ